MIINTYLVGMCKYSNEITKKLDKLTLDKNKIEGFYNYIYGKKINNSYVIRYPGASRGCIEVDSKNVITDIRIYETNKIYSDLAEEILREYIGSVLVFK